MQMSNSYFSFTCMFHEFVKFACMASKSVEDFLNDLEPELNKYAKSLQDQGFTSTNMLISKAQRFTRYTICHASAPSKDDFERGGQTPIAWK